MTPPVALRSWSSALHYRFLVGQFWQFLEVCHVARRRARRMGGADSFMGGVWRPILPEVYVIAFAGEPRTWYSVHMGSCLVRISSLRHTMVVLAATMEPSVGQTVTDV